MPNIRDDFDGSNEQGACFIVYYGQESDHWAYIYVPHQFQNSIDAYFNSGSRPRDLPEFVEVIERGEGSQPPIDVQKRLYKERGITPVDNIEMPPDKRKRNLLGLEKSD